jgi:hypothetical protein
MSNQTTQAERLMRIETLLETKLDALADGQDAMNRRLDKIEAHQSKQDTDAATDRADLAALKNKGAGLLIGVGLAGGAAGAGISSLLEWFN